MNSEFPQAPLPAPPVPPPPPGNLFGILSLVFGILGIFGCCCSLFSFLGIAGLICGILGLKAVREGKETEQSRTFSMIGIILGSISTFFFVVSMALTVLQLMGIISQDMFKEIFDWKSRLGA